MRREEGSASGGGSVSTGGRPPGPWEALGERSQENRGMGSEADAALREGTGGERIRRKIERGVERGRKRGERERARNRQGGIHRGKEGGRKGMDT